MGFKSRFKELGEAYLSAIEGAVGCRLDADYPGKTFELAHLTATMKRFYQDWSPESKGLRFGEVVYEADFVGSLHSADEIEVPLRQQCRSDPGIFFIMSLKYFDDIRSLLMFADAILFWDPFEEEVDKGESIDKGIAELAFADLRPLRSLIAAGLVVPAQLARTRVAEVEGSVEAAFASNLMWQGVFGADEFNKRLTLINKDKYQLSVPEGPLRAKGLLGHAENKVASLFLPDVVVALMDYHSLSGYQSFCKSLDRGLKAREVEYIHKSLAFETGFLLDPKKLTNDILLNLRGRDSIFAALRNTVVGALDRYEESVSTGGSASFVEEFNIELRDAFRELKAKALVSNTWKEYIDESRSFSTRFMAKVFSAPLHGKRMFADWFESSGDAAITSVANVLVASLKTYSRYRNTKLLMDVAGAIREHHEGETTIAI